MKPVPTRAAETEKITINLGYIDLGYIDLLVAEGVYRNRTDFIRTAVRNQTERHAEITRQSIHRKSIQLGLRNYERSELEAIQASGEMIDIYVLGLVVISSDVSPELARASIASIEVLGSLQMSSVVREALADRLR